jgi:hypothetical protein
VKSLSHRFVQTGYAVKCWKLGSTWEGMGYIQRRVKFKKYVNTALQSCDLPEVGLTDGHERGPLFEPGAWRILFPGNEIMRDDLPWDSFSRMAGTFYHKARHSEQFFRIAQGIAAGKLNLPSVVTFRGEITAQVIAVNCSINGVASEYAFAKKDKYPKEMDFDIRSWYRSIYGAHKVHRAQVLAARGAQAEAAYHEGRRDPDLAKYLSLPEEKDAFHIQDDIQAWLLDIKINGNRFANIV